MFKSAASSSDTLAQSTYLYKEGDLLLSSTFLDTHVFMSTMRTIYAEVTKPEATSHANKLAPFIERFSQAGSLTEMKICIEDSLVAIQSGNWFMKDSGRYATQCREQLLPHLERGLAKAPSRIDADNLDLLATLCATALSAAKIQDILRLIIEEAPSTLDSHEQLNTTCDRLFLTLSGMSVRTGSMETVLGYLKLTISKPAPHSDIDDTETVREEAPTPQEDLSTSFRDKLTPHLAASSIQVGSITQTKSIGSGSEDNTGVQEAAQSTTEIRRNTSFPLLMSGSRLPCNFCPGLQADLKSARLATETAQQQVTSLTKMVAKLSSTDPAKPNITKFTS